MGILKSIYRQISVFSGRAWQTRLVWFFFLQHNGWTMTHQIKGYFHKLQELWDFIRGQHRKGSKLEKKKKKKKNKQGVTVKKSSSMAPYI